MRQKKRDMWYRQQSFNRVVENDKIISKLLLIEYDTKRKQGYVALLSQPYWVEVKVP